MGDRYQDEARQLVERNAHNFPDLLVEQLAGAMRRESEAVAAAARMRYLVGVCLRLAERTGIKPQGDEEIAVRLAAERTHADPRRFGGNGWLDEDQLRMDLSEEFRAA